MSPETHHMPGADTPSADVVVIKKSGGDDPFGSAFHELAESLAHALTALGLQGAFAYNRIRPWHPTIILGALNFTPEEAARIPNTAVIYNLEQVSARDVPIKPHYLDLLRRCRVWDYSRRNMMALRELGITARFIPVGYRPELTRIPTDGVEDIDVLFYGAMNDRRRRILDQLGARGVETVALGNYYGPVRDQFISRAKIVLNTHYYDCGVFEIVRASYLMANHKAVVAERNPDTEIEPDMQDAALFAPYHGLVESCLALLADDARRKGVAARGFQRMSQRDISRFLRPALRDLER